MVKLADLAPAAPYDPMADSLQWLVGDEVRLQRGPLAGTSGRSIHVGNPNGMNYSFDPRLLAVVKIWQGGFLDMAGELVNRGNRGLALGYDSREISFGEREYLLAPLNAAGAPVDFSFKEGKFGDFATFNEALYSQEDQLARIAAVDAQFLGYSRDSTRQARPRRFSVTASARTSSRSPPRSPPTRRPRDARERQARDAAVVRVQCAAADRRHGRAPANWTGSLDVARGQGQCHAAWHDRRGRQRLASRAVKLRVQARTAGARRAAQATLPAGYSIENYYPPKDNYGRDQLFEALGLAVDEGRHHRRRHAHRRASGASSMVSGDCSPKGCSTVSAWWPRTRKGLMVVAGQKAELTRISDTNGDGIADHYETLFDAHSYHANYHSYMHGPVRGKDGAYYFALNLVHDGTGSAYTAGGNVMGTWGGFNGWAVRVEPSGKFELFANGLRSPASLGVGPDGRVWYADNQGDFVATSKLFELQKDRLLRPSRRSGRSAWHDTRFARDQVRKVGRAARAADGPVPAQPRGELAGQSRLGDQRQVRSVCRADADRRPDPVEPVARGHCRKVGRSSRAGQRHAVLRRARVGRHAAGVPVRRQLVVRSDRPRLAGQGWQGRQPAARALGRKNRRARRSSP